MGIPNFVKRESPCLRVLLSRKHNEIQIPYTRLRIPYIALNFDLSYKKLSHRISIDVVASSVNQRQGYYVKKGQNIQN